MEQDLKQGLKGLAQAPVTQRQRDGAAALPASMELCQQGADVKAFKAFTGRGKQNEARSAQMDQVKLQATLDRIHQEMEELARISKTVPGFSFYLSVHRRADHGQHSLRWRLCAGNRHLAWRELPELFAKQFAPIDAWYIATNERVLKLNAEECVVRTTLRAAQRYFRKNAGDGAEKVAL